MEKRVGGKWRTFWGVDEIFRYFITRPKLFPDQFFIPFQKGTDIFDFLYESKHSLWLMGCYLSVLKIYHTTITIFLSSLIERFIHFVPYLLIGYFQIKTFEKCLCNTLHCLKSYIKTFENIIYSKLIKTFKNRKLCNEHFYKKEDEVFSFSYNPTDVTS